MRVCMCDCGSVCVSARSSVRESDCKRASRPRWLNPKIRGKEKIFKGGRKIKNNSNLELVICLGSQYIISFFQTSDVSLPLSCALFFRLLLGPRYLLSGPRRVYFISGKTK